MVEKYWGAVQFQHRHLFGDSPSTPSVKSLLSEAGAAEEAESPAVVPRLLVARQNAPSGHYPSKPIRAPMGQGVAPWRTPPAGIF